MRKEESQEDGFAFWVCRSCGARIAGGAYQPETQLVFPLGRPLFLLNQGSDRNARRIFTAILQHAGPADSRGAEGREVTQQKVLGLFENAFECVRMKLYDYAPLTAGIQKIANAQKISLF